MLKLPREVSFPVFDPDKKEEPNYYALDYVEFPQTDVYFHPLPGANFHQELTTDISAVTRRWDLCQAKFPKEKSIFRCCMDVVDVIRENSFHDQHEFFLIGLPDYEESHDVDLAVNRFYETCTNGEHRGGSSLRFRELVTSGKIRFFCFNPEDPIEIMIGYIYQKAFEIGNFKCSNPSHISFYDQSYFTVLIPDLDNLSSVLENLLPDGIRVVTVDNQTTLEKPYYKLSFPSEDYYRYDSPMKFHEEYDVDIPALHFDEKKELLPPDPDSTNYCNIWYHDTKYYDDTHDSFYPAQELIQSLLYRLEEAEFHQYPKLKEKTQDAEIYYIKIPGCKDIAVLDYFRNTLSYVDTTTCYTNTIGSLNRAIEHLKINHYRNDERFSYEKDKYLSYIFIESALSKDKIEKVIRENIKNLSHHTEIVVIQRSWKQKEGGKNMAKFRRGGSFEQFQKQWEEDDKLEKGVMMLLPKENVFVRATFGSGCNLELDDEEDEDIDDYIYISVVDANDSGLEEVDGGQLDFASSKEDYRTNLQHFCESALDCMDYPDAEYQIVGFIS